MMKITAFTRGMLQFLGSLDQGRGISDLAESIQPVVDVTKFVGFNARRFVSGSSANPPGGGLQVGGPGAVANSANQSWIVRWFGAYIVTDGTGALGGACLAFRGAGGSDPMVLTNGQNIGINSRIAITCPIDQGLLMGPGDQLLLLPNQVGSTNHTWTWGFIYDVVAPAS